jgi:hypothetical protein
MAAVDGPVRRSPAKNVSDASTVETTAMQPTQNQPAGLKPRSAPPVTMDFPARAIAAPVITRVASSTGDTRRRTPSETRM